MPEITDSFTFIGTLNYNEDDSLNTETSRLLTGFPFPLREVDVSVFDYWITLGGFSKNNLGSPTTDQINLSLQNAVKLFYNLYSVTCTYDDAGSTSTQIADASALATPKQRTEPTAEIGTSTPEYGVNIRVSWEDVGRLGNGGFFFQGANFQLEQSVIVRMFDGSEFVGYGLYNSSPNILINGPISSEYTNSDVAYSPTGFIVTASYGNGTPGVNNDIDYTEIPVTGMTGNIPVVAELGIGTIATYSGSLDVADLSIFYTDANTSFSLSLDSLDFYTPSQ